MDINTDMNMYVDLVNIITEYLDKDFALHNLFTIVV
jgi:hypothetical protein